MVRADNIIGKFALLKQIWKSFAYWILCGWFGGFVSICSVFCYKNRWNRFNFISTIESTIDEHIN